MTVVSGTLAAGRRAVLLRVLVAAAGVAGMAVLGSCGSRMPAELIGDELFRLGVGPLDEQLDLVRVAGAPAPHATRVAMRDGLFYVANGNARKVMQLSSHGDLLLLIYDPDRNPGPVGLAAGGNGVATRTAVPHRFRELSHIAVDNRQRILVVDGHLVKRFGPDGSYLDAIGREGRGGAPFPFVERLTVMADDTLVVTARTPEQWITYWYDGDGRLQDRLEPGHARRPGAAAGGPGGGWRTPGGGATSRRWWYAICCRWWRSGGCWYSWRLGSRTPTTTAAAVRFPGCACTTWRRAAWWRRSTCRTPGGCAERPMLAAGSWPGRSTTRSA